MSSSFAFPRKLSPVVLGLHLAMAGAGGFSLLASTAVFAQQSAINIPAGALSESLNMLAERQGVVLSYEPSLVKGLRNTALSGQLTFEQAATQLLAGTGVALQPTSTGYTLVKNSPTGAATLKAVTVTATGEPAYGAPAAAGFSAKNAKIGVLGERSLLETPFSVNVISSEQLESAGVNNLANLVRLDPSLTSSFSAVGYYDAVSIRGLSLNNWTNYYKNGLLFANQAKTPFENIERVEVMRGLTGFLQGFAAPGGAINYVTERPTPTWQRKAEIVVDEFGTLMPGIDVGGPLTEDGRVGIRINAAGGQENYFVDEVETDRGFASVALDWLATDRLTIQLDAQVDQREGTTQPSLELNTNGQIPQGVDPSRYLGQPWATYDTLTREYALAADFRINEQWKASFKINDAHLYRDDFSANIGNIQPNGDFDIQEYKSIGEVRDSRNMEVAVYGDFKFGATRHEVAAGYTQRKLAAVFGNSVFRSVGTSNLYNHVIIADPGGVPGEPRLAILNRDKGVFVSDFMTFNEQWQALVGLRSSEVEFFSVFSPTVYEDTVTTPTLALIYKPVPSTSIYASYVEGLEQGGTAPNNANNRNEQLEPVTAEQTEIGVKTEWFNGKLITTAALFETEVPLSYLDQTSNVFGYFGTRRHRGIELTGTGEIWEGGRINAGLVALDAKALNTGTAANDNKVPQGVAERQATLWLDQKTGVQGLSVQFGLRHSGERAVNPSNSVFVPAWTVADAGVRYSTKLAGKNVDLGLLEQNLTDKTYINETGFGSLYFGSTRATSLTASFEF
ncbi:TonB-dependent siderophore receptor [Limnobacter alexandrii]|jgi:iron complex outermembrane recepter protein|uniref:TonB-dependent siderophore receptor n=1 Tax=Limnobacter alexandrii TaxID=2570352 RepID=UPI00148690D1|nr:TonB-dependent receptor [Limnobacter alexandrii]